MFGYTHFAGVYYPPLKQKVDTLGWSNEFFWAILSPFYSTMLFILIGTFYTVLYVFEIPFFEKYKVQDEPWPWKEDFEKWRELLNESLMLIVFNLVCITLSGTSAQYLLGLPVKFDFRADQLPSTTTFIVQFMFC